MRSGVMILQLLAAAAVAHAGLAAPAEDRAALLEGVREIAAPGVPGSVVACAPGSFPLLVGRAEGGAAAFAAAGPVGRGRAVIFGHDGVFLRDALAAGDTGRLLRNAAAWAGGRPAPRVGVIGAADLLAFYRAAGLDASEVRPDADLSAYHVLALTHTGMPETALPRLRRFVQGGGGLIAASTGWGWAQITGREIPEHPGNRLLRGAGLAWTGGTLDRTSRRGFDASGALPRFVSAAEALPALLQRAALPPGETRQAVASCLLAARSLPADDGVFLPRLRELRRAAGTAALPTQQSPVSAQAPLARLALALDTEEARRLPAGRLKAHPAAADFPGAVPAEAARVTRTVRVDLSVPGWHGTGLYAAPGERVTVTVAGAPPRGLALRIGAHTDELWHLDAWKRAPAISRSFPIAGGRTETASAFGGLLYVEVPDRAAGTLEVTLAGAVPAPRFRLGETSPGEWRNSLRQAPAPWAELEGRRIILTVPSALVRGLEDPEPVMGLWDRAVEAQEALVARPARRRPERIVTDRQISAGYMHAGYPIMAPVDDTARLALEERRLRAEGSWGYLHELGHNLQDSEWTFEGTGEVTNNVLAMYVYPTVLGLPFDSGHPAIRDRAKRADRVRRYLDGGARFEEWKGDPFLALTMYIQVIEAFGWEPLRRVFAEYRSLPAAERPRSEIEKRDQWLIRLSRATGRNLGPFFQSWGVPTSAPARAAVAALPEWRPPAEP